MQSCGSEGLFFSRVSDILAIHAPLVGIADGIAVSIFSDDLGSNNSIDGRVDGDQCY
jgi:hypothetical protein